MLTNRIEGPREKNLVSEYPNILPKSPDFTYSDMQGIIYLQKAI